jgi:ABC-type lipoprotein release transport system permease subunit
MLADLRIAFRQLARSPGFAAVIVACLAVGIGANATVLSWVRHTLEGTVRDIDPDVALLGTRTMRAQIQGGFFVQHVATQLLSWLGGVAVLLAAMGVYAVMAHGVSQRTQELGVRIALGATPRGVLAMVLRQGAALATIGLVCGLVASLVALARTSLMTGFLHGVSPFDPLVFTAAPLFLTGVALLAAWLPARRATRVDPVLALRSE